MKKPYRVYAAGPQVFLEHAKAFYAYAVEAAKEFNIELLVPWTETVPPGPEIYLRNVKMLRESDGVVVNLNPFRGTEPDSGTVWEMGFAAARNKPVVGYLSEKVMTTKARALDFFYKQGLVPNHDGPLPDGMHVEDFGHKLNLMLHFSCAKLEHTFTDALGAMEGELDRLADFQRLRNHQEN